MTVNDFISEPQFLCLQNGNRPLPCGLSLGLNWGRVCMILGDGEMCRTFCPGTGLAPKHDSPAIVCYPPPPSFGDLGFPSYKTPRGPPALTSVALWPPTYPGGVNRPSGPLFPHLYVQGTGQAGPHDHTGLPGPHRQSSPNIHTNSRDTGQWSRCGVWLWTHLLLH